VELQYGLLRCIGCDFAPLDQNFVITVKKIVSTVCVCLPLERKK